MATLKDQLSTFFKLTAKIQDQDHSTNIQELLIQIDKLRAKYLSKKKLKEPGPDYLKCVTVLDSLPSRQALPELQDLSRFLQEKVESLQEIVDSRDYDFPEDFWEEVESITP